MVVVQPMDLKGRMEHLFPALGFATHTPIVCAAFSLMAALRFSVYSLYQLSSGKGDVLACRTLLLFTCLV